MVYLPDCCTNPRPVRAPELAVRYLLAADTSDLSAVCLPAEIPAFQYPAVVPACDACLRCMLAVHAYGACLRCMLTGVPVYGGASCGACLRWCLPTVVLAYGGTCLHLLAVPVCRICLLVVPVLFAARLRHLPGRLLVVLACLGLPAVPACVCLCLLVSA